MSGIISHRILMVFRACTVTAYLFSALVIVTIARRWLYSVICDTCDYHVARYSHFRSVCNHSDIPGATARNLTNTLVKLEYRQPTIPEIESANPKVEEGGSWQPEDCQSHTKVAILVPYRDREVQLRQFLAYIHPYLQAKQQQYRIYIIQQTNSSKFNRGRLLNIGYSQASKDQRYDCYICHDVDRLPVSVATPYACAEKPRQIGVLQEYRNVISPGGWTEYTFPLGYVGGVTAMTGEQFTSINGYSNQFFGWGGEDDDLRHRFLHHGLNYTRVSVKLGRFRHLTHQQEKKNPLRTSLMISGKKRFRDGLSNLQYTLVDYTKHKLYTLITADFQPQGQPGQ